MTSMDRHTANPYHIKYHTQGRGKDDRSLVATYIKCSTPSKVPMQETIK